MQDPDDICRGTLDANADQVVTLADKIPKSEAHRFVIVLCDLRCPLGQPLARALAPNLPWDSMDMDRAVGACASPEWIQALLDSQVPEVGEVLRSAPSIPVVVVAAATIKLFSALQGPKAN